MGRAMRMSWSNLGTRASQQIEVSVVETLVKHVRYPSLQMSMVHVFIIALRMIKSMKHSQSRVRRPYTTRDERCTRDTLVNQHGVVTLW